MCDLESGLVLGKRLLELRVAAHRFDHRIVPRAAVEKDTLGDVGDDRVEHRVAITDQHVAKIIATWYGPVSYTIVRRLGYRLDRHIGAGIEPLNRRQQVPVLQHLLQRDVTDESILTAGALRGWRNRIAALSAEVDLQIRPGP